MNELLLATQRDFLVREKFLSIQDKVEIMNPLNQDTVGFFQRKLLSIPALYCLYNRGLLNEMIVQQKLLAVRPTYKFYTGNDNDQPDNAAYEGALVKRIISVGPSYWFEKPDGTRLFEVQGDLIGLTYGIVQDGKEIADISRTLWAIRDTYGVRINPEVPNPMALLVLCSVVVIHAIHVASRRRI
ncbi:MAG TPA: hypothetical protein VMH22_06960 [bacterium]|nr:hypothetical protein [bacterium]